jgi:hypothetical protein
VTLALVWLWPGSARAAKRHDADRFDVRISLQPDGTTRVAETVVFRFSGGTFTRVTRELPLRKTDGIEVLEAGIDGVAVAVGGGADRRIETSRRENRLRVVWRFPETDGTHEFTITYVVRGLVAAGDVEDVLEWAALPRDRDYRIARSSLTLEWPDAARPQALTAGGRPLVRDGQRVALELSDPGKNESVTFRVAFAPGTAAPRPAGWQERAALRRRMAPAWATAAVSLFATVSVLFWFFWVRSPRPAGAEALGTDEVTSPPGRMPPAAAGALMTGGGRPSSSHLMGALVDLARKGIVRIEERPPGRWGSRKFVVLRKTARNLREAPAPLAPHEQAALQGIFTGKGRTEGEVEMAAVRARLTSGAPAITAAVRQELRDAGLIDPDRLRARRRMMSAAVLVLSAGVAALLFAIPFTNPYGGWPALPALGLGVASLVGFAFAAAIQAQTDEGRRRGERWRRYASHLKRASAKGETAPVSADELPYAVAFDVASAYAKALTHRGAQVPAWFHAASLAPDQQHAAFVSLMAAGAVSGTGGGTGGAGGGGAAGGGSSSAS